MKLPFAYILETLKNLHLLNSMLVFLGQDTVVDNKETKDVSDWWIN